MRRLAVLGVAFISCSQPSTSPTAPSTSQPAPFSGAFIANPGSNTTAAVVEIRDLDVSERRLDAPSFGFTYALRFQLVETGRNSAATIENIEARLPTGDSESTGRTCWVKPLRVAPGGAFVVDEGLGYCSPGVGSPVPVSEIGLLVAFKDDAGRIGTVGAIAKVMK